MFITQATVDELLASLKRLLDEIIQLRRQTGELEAGLAQVQRDYESKLSELNAELAHLEYIKADIVARLTKRTSVREVTDTTPQPSLQPLPEPPPPVAVGTPTTQGMPTMSLNEVPRSTRKRALADHVEYFVAADEREVIMQVINAVLGDDQRDVGDMLELLEWGPIWSACADWENVEDQYTRLVGWQQVLSERLIYWQNEENRLKHDGGYGLLEQRLSRSPQAWEEYLEKTANDQREEIERLAHEVKILERQFGVTQSESEAAGG